MLSVIISDRIDRILLHADANVRDDIRVRVHIDGCRNFEQKVLQSTVNTSGNGYMLQVHAIAIYALGLVRKRTVVTDTVDPSVENLCSSQAACKRLTATFSEHLTAQWNVQPTFSTKTSRCLQYLHYLYINSLQRITARFMIFRNLFIANMLTH